jgi:predicted  nucleic acid-binding Zn-ribbon protein
VTQVVSRQRRPAPTSSAVFNSIRDEVPAMTRHFETLARVEFRWRQHEADFARRLTESARQMGRAPSDHARELMKSALTSNERLEHNLHTIQQELAQLHAEIAELRPLREALPIIHENIYQLRDDLATYVVQLLAEAGRMEPEKAERWVKRVIHAE